jgi:fibronectin type 3 domain-containing protein
MKARLWVLSLVASAMLIGCAGVSTSSRDTGAGASAHSVGLSWDASTSAEVSGYNIYRAVYNYSCGSFLKINSVPITSTAYSDSEVTTGSSYCYATTAVSTSGAESAYSNIVSSVQIPLL